MSKIRAYAASGAGRSLEPIEFDPGPLGAEDVEVRVESCGICHSDLSMLDNDWGFSAYPFVPGHEAIGTIVDTGPMVKGLKVGQRVGIGWTANSCMHCDLCIAGQHHLCANAQGTIVGRHGAFAERVRAHWAWAIPVPEALGSSDPGPLLCGGITVFSPLLNFNIQPTDRVGVIGIGGLGHMALKFLRAWGCEVIAFTSSASKHQEAKDLGAHRVVSSTDSGDMKKLARSLHAIIVTVNVPLDWPAVFSTLRPNGRLHVVGAVLEPIPVPAFTLIGSQLQVSGSPTGSPGDIRAMLDFAARHRILPQVEHFPMSKVNDAMEHLKKGKPRYRIVLDADFK